MISRDSLVLWLGLFISILGFLLGIKEPPSAWTWHQWLQIVSGVLGLTVAWLRSSPLASSTTPTRDATTALGVFRVYDKKG